MKGDTVAEGRLYARKTTDERRRERRQRLLDAGLAQIGRSGIAGATVSALCRRARVSARTFYEEFANTEELVIALHDEVNARAYEAVVAAIAGIPLASFPERARAGVGAYMDVMTRDPRWARITLVETVGLSPRVDAHRRASIDRFAAMLRGELERTADAGLIPRRDFALTSLALVGAINELVMTWTHHPDWEARVEDVVEEAARLIVAAGRG